MSVLWAGDDNPKAPATESAKTAPKPSKDSPDEAPAAFDDRTNGFEDQDAFDDDKKTFSKPDDVEHDGLGPVYNATSCVACHQNPVAGGSSQVVEIRGGRHVVDTKDPNPRRVRFEEPPGGSVIQQRATDPSIQEVVPPEDDVRTFRLSNSVLGNGFVEVLSDQQILDVRKAQRRYGMEGFAVVVPVVVEPTKGTDGTASFRYLERIGRFGWKCQEASLMNFSAGAYITEIGITSPMQPEELTSNGRDVSMFDKVKDPEDPAFDEDDKTKPRPFGNDVEAFTRFMRSTKVPPRDAAATGQADVIAGEKLFRDNAALGCAVCHHPDYTTPMAGTKIVTLTGDRGSDLEEVPEALGNKVIHPYSDFLLHDIGTGDGIAQTQHSDLPARGQRRHINRLPEEKRHEERIGRVVTVDDKDEQRTLVTETAGPAPAPESGLDQRTSNKVRTAPLWGLRTRPQLMHDGLSLTIEDAIHRHRGQAEGVRLKYEALTEAQRAHLLAFLRSL